MHFKDTNNNIHFLDDASFIHLLPSDCVEITQEEADILSQPIPPTPEQAKELIKQQIYALEVKDIMNRKVREWFLLQAVKEAAALGYTEAQAYALNPAYRNAKDLDNMIKALRTQL